MKTLAQQAMPALSLAAAYGVVAFCCADSLPWVDLVTPLHCPGPCHRLQAALGCPCLVALPWAGVALGFRCPVPA